MNSRTFINASTASFSSITDEIPDEDVLGDETSRDRARPIAQVDYLGVVDLLDAWRPALAAATHAKFVVSSSNSTTSTPAVPARTVRAFVAHDAEEAVRSVRFFGKDASTLVYARIQVRG